MKRKIAIIGGGAAGMMCALQASENSEVEVHLFEKNAFLGHKVMISGGGRCNVTTGLQDVKEILKRYPRGERFLKHAFYEWSPRKMIDFMEAHGVPLKTEEDLRVFPESDNGKDVVGVFERALAQHDVHVHLKSKIEDCHKEGDHFILHSKEGSETFDALVLTTGGQAYQHTGSTGDAYAWAKDFGHSLSPLAPSLNAFVIQEDWLKKHSGVSFENIGLTLKGEKQHKWKGPALITHKGLTGPACFALSALAAFEDYKTTLLLEIDFVPALHEDALREALQKRFQAEPKKELQSFLRAFLPKKFVESLLEVFELDGKKYACHSGKEDLKKCIKILKALPLHIIGRSAGDEFVTAGGVLTEEIDAKSMESKLCPGLFFAGEIVNVDGFTGGFNLHAAWATGFIAGRSVAKESPR